MNLAHPTIAPLEEWTAVKSIPWLKPSDLTIQVAHWWLPCFLPSFGASGNLFLRRLPLAQDRKIHKLREARLLSQIVAIPVGARAMPNQ